MTLLKRVPLSTLILALALTLVVGHGLVHSEDEPKGDGQPAAPMPGMTPEMLARITPNEHNKALEYFIGDWDVEMKLTMKMEGMPPIPPTTGSATYKWAIEGRWLQQEVKGTIMGRPYHGTGFHGYDPMTMNHITAWISNADCQLNLTTGVTVDPEGKVQAQYGRMNEWMTGEVNKPLKVVTTKVSDDKFTMSVWDLGIGGDGREVFLWTYTRKK